MTSDRLAGRFWLLLWSATLSWCWLLPNHYKPWSTFHMDAWAGIAMATMAGFVLWATRHDRSLSWVVIGALLLSVMPWLQFLFGQIHSFGTAAMASGYLLGFALAALVGQRWETASPGQPGDGVFLAVGIGAMLSVGMQLHQWLHLSWSDIWMMGEGYGRPFANFGQPNQLATFLLWGCLALAWAHLRGHARLGVTVFGAAFLLFGVALTASRTAWLGMAIAVVAAWYWRRQWPHRFAPWVVTGLALLLAIWVVAIAKLEPMLLLGTDGGYADLQARLAGEQRTQIWPLFFSAAMQRPWFGYGWNQVAHAHLEVAADHPALNILFAHSHNLFLDLMLWSGIPIGLCIVGFLLAWLWRRVRMVRDAKGVVIILLLLVMGNHAMLELPLHHAYFLLPIGLLAGALESHQTIGRFRRGPRWLGVSAWLVATLLLAAVVRDYLRIESSYQTLRFEWANVRTNEPRAVPSLWVLDQLGDLIWISRFEPSRDMAPGDLRRMRETASLYPSVPSIHKLATALAWNGEPAEAASWLRKMCMLSPKSHCEAIRRAWTEQAARDPLVAAVSW